MPKAIKGIKNNVADVLLYVSIANSLSNENSFIENCFTICTMHYVRMKRRSEKRLDGEIMSYFT